MRSSPIVVLSALGMIVCSAVLPQGQSSGTGVVRGSRGEPLADVWVQELGARNGIVTGSDGVFQFPRGRKLTLLFAKQEMRPSP